MSAGDLFGVSQPTVSRIWRHLLPLIQEVTCMKPHRPDRGDPQPMRARRRHVRSHRQPCQHRKNELRETALPVPVRAGHPRPGRHPARRLRPGARRPARRVSDPDDRMAGRHGRREMDRRHHLHGGRRAHADQGNTCATALWGDPHSLGRPRTPQLSAAGRTQPCQLAGQQHTDIRTALAQNCDELPGRQARRLREQNSSSHHRTPFSNRHRASSVGRGTRRARTHCLTR